MADKVETLKYGVWLPGKGWLKAKNPTSGQTQPFATTLHELAEGAVSMLHAKAEIRPIDDSMVALEDEFLRLESERNAKRIGGGEKLKAWFFGA